MIFEEYVTFVTEVKCWKSLENKIEHRCGLEFLGLLSFHLSDKFMTIFRGEKRKSLWLFLAQWRCMRMVFL